jgi:hypothetical protein
LGACCPSGDVLASVETTQQLGWHTQVMSNGLLLLPDFLLIVCGFVLCRYTALDRPVWESAERLVYYLLFPVLLFNSIVKQPAAAGADTDLALCGRRRHAVRHRIRLRVAAGPGVDARLHARARRSCSASTRSSRSPCPSVSAARRAWPGWH